nr:hypothetical protein [uncultured Draconibacterium sp.]
MVKKNLKREKSSTKGAMCDVQAAIVGASHGGGHFSDPKVIKIMVDFLDKALK